MSARKLGRGLDSLIGGRGRRVSEPADEPEASADDGPAADEPAGDEAPEEREGASGPVARTAAKVKRGGDPEAASTGGVLEIPVAAIRPNARQPRRSFPSGELEMLKLSIAQEGVLQPVLVRSAGSDRYEIVAGERRLRASVELGRKTVPAIVIAAADDRMLELALIENIQRHDLNPIEIAEAYRNLLEEHGLKQDDLANRLGVSRSSVANLLRLLDLPEAIRNALERSRISLGHAKVLASVGDETEQRRLFDRIAEENLSVRDLEDERERSVPPSGGSGGGGGGGKKRSNAKKKSPQIASLEEQFSERLGTKVTIREGRGKGRIQIEFYSREDFERIRESILAR